MYTYDADSAYYSVDIQQYFLDYLVYANSFVNKNTWVFCNKIDKSMISLAFLLSFLPSSLMHTDYKQQRPN